MANNGNLKKGNPDTEFKSGRKAVESGRKGGKKSGESKRAKKTFQTLMNEILNSSVADNPQLKKMAAQLGLDSDADIKQLMTMVSVLNTLKKGKTADIIEMATFLGEVEKSSNKDILDKLDGVLKNIESSF